MIVAVFLGVLILALLIGNALLFVVPKKSAVKAKPAVPEPKAYDAYKPSFSSETETKVQTVVMDERILLLNKRIERLENSMAKLKPGLSSGADSPVLAKKILELEEFKRNARLEIEAIKERLSETRKELKLAEKTPKKDNYPISNQELHSLVFNKN